MQFKLLIFILSIIPFFSYAKTIPNIGFVVKSINNDFFKEMENGAKKYNNLNNNEFNLIFKSIPNETDSNLQIKIINDLINTNIEALIVAPVDSKKIIPVLLNAINKNIIVINIDNKIDERTLLSNNVTIPFVGPSNYDAALEAAKILIDKKLKPNMSAAIIEGISSSINAKARSDGFRDALLANHINIADVRSGFWEEGKAYWAAMEILKLHPEIKAILCGNDNMAIGALKAIKKMNLQNKIEIIGYDNIPKILPFIKSREIFSTVDQYPGIQAEKSIEMALNALSKQLKQSNLPLITKTPTKVIWNTSVK